MIKRLRMSVGIFCLLFFAALAMANKSEKLNEHRFLELFFDTFRSSYGSQYLSIGRLICNRGSNTELCDATECDIKKIVQECIAFDKLDRDNNLIIFVQQGSQFFILVRVHECIENIGTCDLWSESITDDINMLANKAAEQIIESQCSSKP